MLACVCAQLVGCACGNVGPYPCTVNMHILAQVFLFFVFYNSFMRSNGLKSYYFPLVSWLVVLVDSNP